jgi:hypothetical protein
MGEGGLSAVNIGDFNTRWAWAIIGNTHLRLAVAIGSTGAGQLWLMEQWRIGVRADSV